MAIVEFFSNPSTVTELTALIVGLLFLPEKKKLFPGAFLYYLLFVLCIEALGFSFRLFRIPNGQIYNLLMLVQTLFFAWIFYRFHNNPKMKTWIRWLAPIFPVLLIAETAIRYTTLPIQEHYSSYFRILISVQVMVLSFSFYLQLLKDDTLDNPLQDGRFWIVTGLFFFYLGSTPISSFAEQIIKIKLAGNISFYTLVMGCINIVLYGCWILGFLCLRKNHLFQPSSSSQLSSRW